MRKEIGCAQYKAAMKMSLEGNRVREGEGREGEGKVGRGGEGTRGGERKRGERRELREEWQGERGVCRG